MIPLYLPTFPTRILSLDLSLDPNTTHCSQTLFFYFSSCVKPIMRKPVDDV